MLKSLNAKLLKEWFKNTVSWNFWAYKVVLKYNNYITIFKFKNKEPVKNNISVIHCLKR